MANRRNKWFHAVLWFNVVSVQTQTAVTAYFLSKQLLLFNDAHFVHIIYFSALREDISTFLVYSTEQREIALLTI